MLGHEPRIVQGRRVTTDIDLDVTLMTVCGAINARLVATLQSAGLPAVGLTGASAHLIGVVRRRPWTINGEAVDFGHVGDIKAVNPSVIDAVTQTGAIPVVASLGIDRLGNLFNVNADTTAAHLAAAIDATDLFLVTEIGGLFHGGSLLETCDEETLKLGTNDGWVTAGMKVKLEAGFHALSAGVGSVCIVGPSLGQDGARKTRLLGADSNSEKQ